MKTSTKEQVFFAINTKTNRAEIVPVNCFEQLQGMFRCGILLSDGSSANGIGRCKSVADFTTRAVMGKITVLHSK